MIFFWVEADERRFLPDLFAIWGKCMNADEKKSVVEIMGYAFLRDPAVQEKIIARTNTTSAAIMVPSVIWRKEAA